MLILDRLPYGTLQWLVAAFALLHNVEEAVMVPVYMAEVRRRLAGRIPARVLAMTQDLSLLEVALVLATVVPAVVVLVARRGRPSQTKAWVVVFVQSLFLANVFVPHVPAAIALGGYAPGLVTAVAINLPYSVYFLRRTIREQAVSGRGVAMAVGLAVPGLLVGLGLFYSIAGELAERTAAPN